MTYSKLLNQQVFGYAFNNFLLFSRCFGGCLDPLYFDSYKLINLDIIQLIYICFDLVRE